MKKCRFSQKGDWAIQMGGLCAPAEIGWERVQVSINRCGRLTLHRTTCLKVFSGQGEGSFRGKGGNNQLGWSALTRPGVTPFGQIGHLQAN